MSLGHRKLLVALARQHGEKIRDHAEPFFKDILDFYAMTGLRSQELCWLLKSDVILSPRPFIHIRTKKCPITGKFWKRKFNKSRIVPLCSVAASIPQRAVATSKGPWLFSTAEWKRNPAGRCNSERMLDALAVALAGAGIIEGTIHSLRHSFCAFAANNKIPAFKEMKILGHGSLDIVLRYYHIDDNE